MNGNFYQSADFPEAVNNYDTQERTEHNYLENILKSNKGRVVKVYATYPESNEFRDKIFSGVIEAAGQGHLILSDPKDGKWYLILLFYLDYIEFEEKIDY